MDVFVVVFTLWSHFFHHVVGFGSQEFSLKPVFVFFCGFSSFFGHFEVFFNQFSGFVSDSVKALI